jgi:hypothetical protein
MTKIRPGVFLLRKSKTGENVPLVRDQDLPMQFTFSGRTFEINRTRSGRLLMQEIK